STVDRPYRYVSISPSAQAPLGVFDLPPWVRANPPSQPRPQHQANGQAHGGYCSVAPPGQSDSHVEHMAVAWLKKRAAAISGKDGHTKTLLTAGTLGRGFLLDRYTCRYLLMTHWNRMCQPPWSREELEHKLDEVENHWNDTRPDGWMLREKPPGLGFGG